MQTDALLGTSHENAWRHLSMDEIQIVLRDPRRVEVLGRPGMFCRCVWYGGCVYAAYDVSPCFTPPRSDGQHESSKYSQSYKDLKQCFDPSAPDRRCCEPA